MHCNCLKTPWLQFTILPTVVFHLSMYPFKLFYPVYQHTLHVWIHRVHVAAAERATAMPISLAATVLAASLLVATSPAASYFYDLMDPIKIDDQTCSPDDSALECLCNSNQPKTFGGGVVCMRDTNLTNKYSSRAVVKPLYCIWYENSTQQLLAGLCPFGRQPSEVTINRTIMVEEAGSMTCGSGHTGAMCGRCEPSHSLLFNSYTFECRDSHDCSTAYWILFFFQQLLPTLVFFAVFTFFNIKAIQGYLNAFILAAQIVSVQMNLISIYLSWSFALKFNNYVARKLTDTIATIYSIWNLDVFFGLIPTYCVKNNLSTLPAIALQYISGIFPILVVLLSYLVIELHQYNFRLVVLMWKPFHKCCIRFRRRMSPQTTVIDALAMFIVLSYTKFVVTSSMLLAPNWLSTQSGSTAKTVFLYDGNIEYLNGEHAPYAALAIFVYIFFVIPLPLLLLLYPLTCFQKCLNRFKLRRHFITAFTDALQGCYKDGSDGTRDCRYFAALYFLLRIVINGLYALLYTYNVVLFFFMNTCLLLILGTIILQQPYKKELYNKIDTVMFIYFTFIVSLISFNRFFWSISGGSLVAGIVLHFSLCLPAIVMAVHIICRCSKKLRRRKLLSFQNRTYSSIQNEHLASLEGLIAENQ